MRRLSYLAAAVALIAALLLLYLGTSWPAGDEKAAPTQTMHPGPMMGSAPPEASGNEADPVVRNKLR